MALRGGYVVRETATPSERIIEYLWDGKVIKRYVDPLPGELQPLPRGTQRKNRTLQSVVQPMPPPTSNSLNTHAPISAVLTDLTDPFELVVGGGGEGPTTVPVSGGPPVGAPAAGSSSTDSSTAGPPAGPTPGSAPPAGPLAPGNASAGSDSTAFASANLPFGWQDTTGQLGIPAAQGTVDGGQSEVVMPPRTSAVPPGTSSSSLWSVLESSEDPAFQIKVEEAADVESRTSQQAANAGIPVPPPPPPNAPGWSFEGSAAVPPAATMASHAQSRTPSEDLAALEDELRTESEASTSVAVQDTNLDSYGIERLPGASTGGHTTTTETTATTEASESLGSESLGSGTMSEKEARIKAARAARGATAERDAWLDDMGARWMNAGRGERVPGTYPATNTAIVSHHEPARVVPAALNSPALVDSVEAAYLAGAHSGDLGEDTGGNPTYEWLPGRSVRARQEVVTPGVASSQYAEPYPTQRNVGWARNIRGERVHRYEKLKPGERLEAYVPGHIMPDTTIPQIAAAADKNGPPVRRFVGWAPGALGLGMQRHYMGPPRAGGGGGAVRPRGTIRGGGLTFTPVTSAGGMVPAAALRAIGAEAVNQVPAGVLAGIGAVNVGQVTDDALRALVGATPAETADISMGEASHGRVFTGEHRFPNPKPAGWNKKGKALPAGMVAPASVEAESDAHKAYTDAMHHRRLLAARLRRAQTRDANSEKVKELLEDMKKANERVEAAKERWQGTKGPKKPRKK